MISVPWSIGGLALDGRLWANATHGLNHPFANANWSRHIVDGPIWESVVELGYQFQLGSNVSVQPNLQYIFNPMGRGRVEDPLVLGLQLSLRL